MVFWTSYCASASADIGDANWLFDLKRDRILPAICHAIKQNHTFARRSALHAVDCAALRRLPLPVVVLLPQRLLRHWAASIGPTDSASSRTLALKVLQRWDSELSNLCSSLIQSNLIESMLSPVVAEGLSPSEAPLPAFVGPAHCRPPDNSSSPEFKSATASHDMSFLPELCPAYWGPDEAGPSYPLLCWPSFSYVESFAGSSAFSEKAIPLGGRALGFVEWEESDHPLLHNLEPSAWICGDFYSYSWQQHNQQADALLSWPMCKHLASCGLLRQQHDDVASQLWDTTCMAVHFGVKLVATENVTRLEFGNAEHGLLDADLQHWGAAGFSLAAVWRVNDNPLGGATWRERTWIIKECARLTSRLPPLHQPPMEASPQCMRSLVLPVCEVQLLQVLGTVHKQPRGISPGLFSFTWTNHLQPGTVVGAFGLQGTFCVYTDRGTTVCIRSTNLRAPTFYTVPKDHLTATRVMTTVRSLDSPCHTIRSSPDPPGNCLILDDRFSPPMVRQLHDSEVWLFQGRSKEQLDVLLRTAPAQVVHTAGKAVTGCMAQFMAEAVQSRCALLNAADLGGMSPLAEPLRCFVLFIPFCMRADTAFVACQGSLLMGDYIAQSRDSVNSLASKFMRENFGCDSPALLVGETAVGDCWRWVVACPVETTVQARSSLQSHFAWQSMAALKGCAVWSALVAAKIRLCEYFRPSRVIWQPEYALGKSVALAVNDACVPSPLSWEQQCSRAHSATIRLQLAFETAADCAWKAGDSSLTSYLLSWHCKIQPFHASSVPEQLTSQIPAMAGFQRHKFPCPHDAPVTAWLPLKVPQRKLMRKVSDLSDFFTPAAWARIKSFLEKQDSWLNGDGPRPELCAISESDWVDWARGMVLDLRRLSEGIVTELDYAAPTPTKFNTAAIAERLKDYPDQELVSFFVLGVRYKADLAHQLVFNHHLLNLKGYHEEVYADVATLADDPYGWVGLFDHPPFLPCRFNGNGQVPKGPKIRPVQESGGPRKRSFDSSGKRVFSLNEYVDGIDLLENKSGAALELQLKSNATKWPSESKPTAQQLRKTNCIINEGASLCGLDTYVVTADWFKYFNQWMLAPECYWMSCNCFPGGRYITNYCMTFGISMASNVAQRGANAFVLVFLQEFALLDAPFLLELAAGNPEFTRWLEGRSRLGPLQAALLWMMCYTDDPVWVIAGADRVVRALKLWQCVGHLFGLLPAHPDKHRIGLNVLWLGLIHHVFFGLTEIPERKALKAIVGLTAAVNGELLAADGVSLLGLLEHIRHALGIKGVMRLFILWNILKQLEPGEAIFLVGAALELAQDWMSLLLSSRGSSVASVITELPPPSCAWSWSIAADAALEPPEEAGIGGFIAGWHWRVPVSDGLHGLTIPVLELLAAGVNLIVLHSLLGSPVSGSPQYWVKWEVDALGAHFVLKNDSSRSPMMVLVHRLIMKSDAFKYFRPALLLCHTYGPANPGDAASRGNVKELHSLSSCLNFTLRELELPAVALSMIDDAVSANSMEQRSVSWMVHDFCRKEPPELLPVRTSVKGPAASHDFCRDETPELLPVRASVKRPAACQLERLQSSTAVLLPIRGTKASRQIVHDSYQIVLPARAKFEQPGLSLGPQAQVVIPIRANVAAPQLLAATDKSESLALALHADTSRYALAPHDPTLLAHLCKQAHGLLARSYSPSTCKRDAAAFARWAAYCRLVNTTPWRDDAAANSGTDPAGFQRECVLLINFLVSTQQSMGCRPCGSGRTKAKPESAMAYVRAVRRVFKANMIPLISLSAVTRALTAMNRDYLKEFGQGALTPRRAAPFTNELLTAMLASSGVLTVSSQKTVDWSEFEGLNLKAALALARSSGMRKSELVSEHGSHSLCFGNVSFMIGGVLRSSPSHAQLDLLAPGDYLVVLPPPSKSDQFGIVWGSLPIYIHYQNKPGNAVLLVARIFKLRPEAAASDPLLCSAPGKPFTHSFMDRALKAWLVSTGMTVTQAALYSWHSARAYLACALIAANREPHLVQAMCRWQSADSLRVYACLNPAAYAAHLQAAEQATVAGIRGAHVPLIDSMDLAFSIQQDVSAA